MDAWITSFINQFGYLAIALLIALVIAQMLVHQIAFV